MKFIISIDGRTCSGKSTIIQLLQQKLKEVYGIDIPCFSCGQYYRTNLHNKIPKEQVDDEMIKFMRFVYEQNDVAIIDGRSVSFAIKSADILQSDKPLLSILFDVDKDVQLSRLLSTRNDDHMGEPLKYAMVRDARDEARCFARYNKSIFCKYHYDYYINTSHLSVQQVVDNLLSLIAGRGQERKKTLLYSEEVDTPMAKKLLDRKDIDVIFLRFSQSLNFSEPYLIDTHSRHVFIVSDSNPLEQEVLRFHSWTTEIGIKPDCFYNSAEYLQEKATAFARSLGLPALSNEQVLWTRDKVEMKRKLKSSGISVTDFQPIESYEDIESFAAVYDYPIIFKRRKGQSCVDTYKLSNNQYMQQMPFVRILPCKFMVEKFNDNKEWIIDALVQDEKVLKTFVTYVPVSPLKAMTDNILRGHIACNEIPDNFNFVPDEFIQNIVTSMKLRNGYIHLECFVDKIGMPTVGEFGWRPSGHRIIENHMYASGIDIYNILTDIAIGKPVDIPQCSKHSKMVGNVFLPRKSGEIIQMPSKEELLTQDGVFNVELFAKVGQNYQTQRKSSETAGYAFVEGNTIADVEKKMERVFQNFYNQTKIR